MDGFKLIKTIFKNRKSIIGVLFDGEDDFNLLAEAVRKEYNLDDNAEIDVYSNDFMVKPNIFSAFVFQFIASPEFVLRIQLRNDDAVSVLTPSDSDIDQHTLSPHINHALESAAPLNNTVTCIGETGFANFPTNTIFIQTRIIDELPTTDDIRNLDDVKLGLKAFEKTGALENRDRIQVAKAVISFTLKDNKSKILKREDFIQLSQSIIEIYPREVKETYYVPFQKGHLAKGKLFDAYNNYRSRLSAAGIINRRIKTKSQENPDSANLPIPENCIQQLDIVENDIRILQLGSAAWETILDKWRSTHSFRLKELEDQTLTTSDYLQKYPVCLHQKSHELFAIDYKILYPGSKTIYEWRSYYNQIIKKAQKLKDNGVKQILTHIDGADDEDSKLALAFMLVPYLLPTSRRSSKHEVQNSFIQHCQNIHEADDEIRAEIKRRKIDAQPKIYLIGDSIKTVSAAYVDLSNHRLKFDNPLKAIETCFHCFMGMNIKYPSQCAHVWIFIQKLVFEVSSPFDTVIPSVNTLMNDLRTDK